jgi:hypothetical protein
MLIPQLGVSSCGQPSNLPLPTSVTCICRYTAKLACASQTAEEAKCLPITQSRRPQNPRCRRNLRLLQLVGGSAGEAAEAEVISRTPKRAEWPYGTVRRKHASAIEHLLSLASVMCAVRLQKHYRRQKGLDASAPASRRVMPMSRRSRSVSR